MSIPMVATQAPQVRVEVPSIQVPAPPTPPVIVQVPGVRGSRSGSPSAVLEGFKAQRSELRSQLERLEEQREEISSELAEVGLSDASKKGLEARITSIDGRIADVERQITLADQAVAEASAVPGAVVPWTPPPRRGPPEEVFVLGGLFMFIVLLPMSIAYARRIWRRSAAVASGVPRDLYDRFNRIDQAIDSVAIEVERIGEGQRYLTRVYADQQGAIGSSQAKPERIVK